jgi:16S rRNA (cytidine1402-2'-O)-methyltransferase
VSRPGALYVIPNLLGVVVPSSVLPQRTIDVARRLTHFVVETPKAARAFLKTLEPLHAMQDIAMTSIDAKTSPEQASAMLAPIHAGADLGLLSDAGCPGVADPGAELVAAAHRAGIAVVPLVGPSALLLALMAAGMNGQAFAFHGYLPVGNDARNASLLRLEADSRTNRRTQLFIETPYRNVQMLGAMIGTLNANTRLCVAVDITLSSEEIISRPIGQWRKCDLARYDKRPALFLLQA